MLEKNQKFKEVFAEVIKQSGKTQAQISAETGVHQSSISKLVKKGKGSLEHVINILEILKISPKHAYNIVIDWLIETAQTPYQSAFWACSKNKHLNEEFYLQELSPCEPWRAYACTALYVKIRDVLNIAKEFGIKDIENIEKIKSQNLLAFYMKFVEKFGAEAAEEILSLTPKIDYPPIICLDYSESRKASEYVKIEGGDGVANFGIPHLVISKYSFGDNGGKISKHRHKYGIEFVLSIQGTFEITYEGKKFNIKLTPESSIYLYDARRDHEIELVSQGQGVLIIARYCPTIRNPAPELFGENGEKIIAL